MKSRMKKITTISLVISIAVVTSYCSKGDISREWPNKEFSTEAWKASPAEKRYVFYHSLIDRKIIEGLSREKVIDLLGKPSSESPDGKYITYILKYVEPDDHDFNSIYILHVDFSPNNKVLDYFLRGD